MSYAIARPASMTHGRLYWTGERIASTGQADLTLMAKKAATFVDRDAATAAAPDLMAQGYKVVELADGREGWGE